MPSNLFYEVVLRKLGFASPSLFVFYVLADLKYLYIRYKFSALLEMEQTSLLAISTPATDGGEYFVSLVGKGIFVLLTLLPPI